MSAIQRRGKRPWSDEEIEALIKLREHGRTGEVIAKALNRPYESVVGTCKKLIRTGRLSPKRRRFWSVDDIAVLRDLSLTEAETAERLHRTIYAVRTARLRFELPRTDHAPWSEAQDADLVRLRTVGLSFNQIACALNRTEAAVANRVTRLIKLGNMTALSKAECGKRASVVRAATRADRWTVEQRRSVVTLWKAGNSAAEIARSLGRSISSIYNQLGKSRYAKLIQPLAPGEVRSRAKRGQAEARDQRYATGLRAVESMPNTKSAGYIIGVLYGDGFITIYEQGRGSIGLKSTNASFCAAFAEALEETFGRRTSKLSRIEPIKEIGDHVYNDVRYYEAFLHSVHIAQGIRRVFGKTDEQSWCANPEYLLRIGTHFADGVIQGFFDAEGSFMKSRAGRYYASACSINERGLKSIHELLLKRGYKSWIGVDKRKQWKIGLNRRPDVERFAAEIGSRIDYKLARMQALCAERRERGGEM